MKIFRQLGTYMLLFALMLICYSSQADAYDKKSVVERFTNCSCGPCATINNAWYNATTASLVTSGSISHIIYNVDWPSPTDPMHLLNAADNNNRRSYYGVSAVPDIYVNGNQIGTSQSALTNSVTNGNAEFAPFNIILTPEVFSNNVINVHVNITRDPADVTTFVNTKIRVALTEKTVAFGSPPGSNGESKFFSVCRKMLPHGNGTEFTIPAPGESIELDFLYNPTSEFLQSVNFDSIRVAAFIQNDDSKEVYQSATADLQPSDNVNAAFEVVENLGASPFEVAFIDLSTATSTSTITSWEWDFDNDGTIDSNEPEPTWIFTDEQSYTVSLTVSDGTTQHTRTIENFITVLGSTSNILVVNGILYSTYGVEMDNFYNNSACFGNNQVDVWDLFGDQGFDYAANANIQQINLLNRSIPNSILNLYQKVIWIGNNFGGDQTFFDADQVIDYVGIGGNFLLATRMANQFFTNELKTYCGIQSFTGDLTATELIALDPNLVNMQAASGHTFVNFPIMAAGTEAISIFDDNTGTNQIAGFRLNKTDEGNFIFIAGRPYRYDNTASATNYEYIIQNWMLSTVVGVNNENTESVINDYLLDQNYPNPFNPETRISYSIPTSEFVNVKVYDMLGREVSTLVNEFQQSNRYSVNFDASNLSSGIYFYVLKAGTYSESKKMILIK